PLDIGLRIGGAAIGPEGAGRVRVVDEDFLAGERDRKELQAGGTGVLEIDQAERIVAGIRDAETGGRVGGGAGAVVHGQLIRKLLVWVGGGGEPEAVVAVDAEAVVAD